MLLPVLFCLAYSPSISATLQAPATQAAVAQDSEYLEYRTWSDQHWRVSGSEPTKLLNQHMPDQKKVSEEKTVSLIQYRTGSGAKYTATIEVQTAKGIKSFILRHVSENGKDNHLDTHISYLGWDNAAHVAVIVNKDGQIRWSQVDPPKTTATAPAPAPSTAKPAATKPAPTKPKTSG